MLQDFNHEKNSFNLLQKGRKADFGPENATPTPTTKKGISLKSNDSRLVTKCTEMIMVKFTSLKALFLFL